MKSYKKKKNVKQRIFLIIGLVLLLAIIYTVSASALKLWPFKIDAQQQSKSQNAPDNNGPAKGQQAPSPTKPVVSPKSPASSTKGTSADNNNNTGQPSGTVTITTASQGQGQDKDALHIRALISGVVSSGTCTLTLTKSSVNHTFTAGIQPGPSTSTCQGFDLSISQQQLSVGTWAISVNVDAPSVQATASSQVTIQ
jgi:hypothetical protein